MMSTGSPTSSGFEQQFIVFFDTIEFLDRSVTKPILSDLMCN